MDYYEDAESTGADGPLEAVTNATEREIMEVLHLIKRDDVDVQPLITMSAGVRSSHEVAKVSFFRLHMMYETPLQVESHSFSVLPLQNLGNGVQKGRTRHPTAPKKLSIQERAVQAKLMTASAKDSLAKSMAAKYNSTK